MELQQQVVKGIEREDEEGGRKRKRESDDQYNNQEMVNTKENDSMEEGGKEKEGRRRLPLFAQLRQEGEQSLLQNVAEEEDNDKKQRWYSYRVLRHHWREVKPKLKALGYTFPESNTINKPRLMLEYVQAALPAGWTCKMLERGTDDESRCLPVVYQHLDEKGYVRVVVYYMRNEKGLKIKKHDFVFYSD